MVSSVKRIDDPPENGGIDEGQTSQSKDAPTEIKEVGELVQSRLGNLPALPAREGFVPPIEYPPPTEVVEAIRNGAAWIGVGIDRRHRQNVTRSRDLELWISYLNNLWAAGQKAFILIADTGAVYNIYAELWRREKNWKEPEKKRTDKQLMAEAQKLARQFAARDKAYLEAIQIVNGVPGSPPNPVYLMSDFLEGNEEFKRLFQKIQELIDNDPTLRQKMWECVPQMIRENTCRGIGEQKFDDIRGSAQTRADEKARNLLNYPAFEVAMILFTRGGTKIGNKPQTPMATEGREEDFKWGEEDYDSLAQFVLDNYAAQLELGPRGEKLQFSYPTVKGARSSVPYHFRTVNPDVLGQVFDIRSFIQGVRAWSNATEASADLEKTKQIYHHFFRRLEASPHLKPEEVASIKRTEVIKLFTEIMIQFTSVPGIKYLILKTRIYETLQKLINGEDAGAEIEALSRGEYGVPFSCPREGRGSNDEAYLMWYLHAMLNEEHGPAVSLSRSEREKGLYKQFGEIIWWLYQELEQRTPFYPRFEYSAERRKGRGRDPFWEQGYTDWCQQEFGADPKDVNWEEIIDGLTA